MRAFFFQAVHWVHSSTQPTVEAVGAIPHSLSRTHAHTHAPMHPRLPRTRTHAQTIARIRVCYPTHVLVCVCDYACAYIYTRVCACMWVHVRVHAHEHASGIVFKRLLYTISVYAYACIRAHNCVHECVRPCVCVCIPASLHRCIPACVRAFLRVSVRAFVALCLCPRIRTCVRACISRLHVFSLACARSVPLCASLHVSLRA